MTRIVLTYEDFVALPDDGNRYELHEGELSVTPAPGRRHQQILLKLALIMAPYNDCIMTNITVVEPDLVYVDAERLRLLRERGLEGAPTLAVEIISPYTGRIDRRRKMDLYARHDVTWYWIVDPDPRTIEAYHLQARAYRLEARLEGATPVGLPRSPTSLDPAAIWP